MWTGTVVYVAGKRYVKLAGGPGAFQIRHVIDPAVWHVWKTLPLLPEELSARFSKEELINLDLIDCAMKFSHEESQSLLEYCARRAFTGVSVPMMRDLAHLCQCDVDAAVPRLELEVVKFLVQKVLGEVSDDEMQELLRLRHPTKADKFVSVITPENQAAVAEVVEAADLAVVMKESSKPRQAAPPRPQASSGAAGSSGLPHAVVAEPAPVAPVVMAEPLGQAAAGEDLVLAEVVRAARAPLRPIVGFAFSVIEAREFLPKVVGCTICIHVKSAWLVKYTGRVTDGPKSHTRTWSLDLNHKMH